MPALETIEQFKNQVFSLADEPAYRSRAGLSPTLDIAPPEPEIDEDLEGLLELGTDESSSEDGNLESLALGLDSGDAPTPLGEEPDLLGDILGSFSDEILPAAEPPAAPPEEPGEPLSETSWEEASYLDDLGDTAALLEGFGDDLAAEPSALESGGFEPQGGAEPLDFGSDSLEKNIFSSESAAESLNFDDLSLGDTDFGFADDESYSDSDFADLGGLASTTEEEVASFDETMEADEFALGDFSSQFGLTAEDTEVTEETLNPAARVDEEIAQTQRGLNLTDEEFLILQKTLAGYPLNLKLAVEELVGEKDVPYEELGKLIRLLVTGGSPRSVASLTGKLLGKTIKIPPGYEKGSGQALEAARSSLGYLAKMFMWPILRRFALGTVALAVVLQLGFSFLYTPWKADTLYKQGYEQILAGDSPAGDLLFQDAWRRWQVEDWVFKYAEAHAAMGEYPRAEQKFRDFLQEVTTNDPVTGSQKNVFLNYNKRALLAYHQLVRDFGYDGLNRTKHYEKAEKLLDPIFRQDFKDKDALLTKGDLYFSWSQYDPSFLEKTMTTLGEYALYHGEDGPVISRRMRIFMALGKEPMILKYKSALLMNPSMAMPAQDTAALADWLINRETQRRLDIARPKITQRTLEEEITPFLSSLEPKKQINYLAGVKELLYKAQEKSPSLPHVHYQLARLFRLQDNQLDEEKALGATDYYLQVLDGVQARKPDIIRMEVDTTNRIGEVFLRKGEVQQASRYFTDAKRLYEDALTSGALTPGEEFGRIYTNLAEVYYRNDPNLWNQALDLMDQAEKNGYVTPDQSYKMGVIHYGRGTFTDAIDRFSRVEHTPGYQGNTNVLYALGNSLFKTGNYFGSMGYYQVLIRNLLPAQPVQKVMVVMEESRNDSSLDTVNRTSLAEVIAELEPSDKVYLEMLVRLWNNLGVATLRSQGASRQDSVGYEDAAGYISRAQILANALGRRSEDMLSGDDTQVQINLRNLVGTWSPEDLDIYTDIPREVSAPW